MLHLGCCEGRHRTEVAPLSYRRHQRRLLLHLQAEDEEEEEEAEEEGEEMGLESRAESNKRNAAVCEVTEMRKTDKRKK